ncbi:MAG: ribosomal protein L13e [Chloroflexi bacterium]|nr:ribosomal protein L13e [Chloroflexota bacterium]
MSQQPLTDEFTQHSSSPTFPNTPSSDKPDLDDPKIEGLPNTEFNAEDDAGNEPDSQDSPSSNSLENSGASDENGDDDERPTIDAVVEPNIEADTDDEDLPTSPTTTSTAVDPAPKKDEAVEQTVTEPNADEDTELRSRSRSTAPRRFPGRRSSFSPRNRGVAVSKNRTPTLSPELICRQDTPGLWSIVLTVPSECNVAQVLQDNTPLPSENDEYLITDCSCTLSIQYADGSESEIALFTDEPLIFKMRRNWEGIGNKVSVITQGDFIVCAPKKWTRTGSAPVEPEACSAPDFRAHFFSTQGDEQQQLGGFKENILPLSNVRIALNGSRVFDDSDDGELFVKNPPDLICDPSVVWARIGEEKQDGWAGTNFKPAERNLANVLGGRQGRFFLRVYDEFGSMVDSGNFRYFAELNEIQVNGKPYLSDTLLPPKPDGHPPASIRFVGRDNITIRPVPATDYPQATVAHDGMVTVATIAADDATSWTLQSDYGDTDVVIRLPRFWWRISRSDTAQTEWRATPLSMSRQEFRERIDAILEIRLPSSKNRITAGFGEDLNQTFHIRKAPDGWICVEVPLSSFIDYEEIELHPYENACFNFRCDETVLTPIHILADQAPEIVSFSADQASIIVGEDTYVRWMTRNAETDGVAIYPDIGTVEPEGGGHVSPERTETFTLRLKVRGMDDVTQALTIIVLPPTMNLVARVRRAKQGRRKGRGFSRYELKSAHLDAREAKKLGIRVDTRRRSKHTDNVRALEGVKVHAQRQ